MTASVATIYAERAAAGDIELDSAQKAVADRLSALNARLATHRLARKSSSLGWLFGNREQREAPLKGLYIHGEVGRGKTMLMDLFFALCPAHRKRRAHFHEFMADVHERIHAYRHAIKTGKISEQDPIVLVARDIAEEAWVLCFDEFHVTDIADAMILGRLFTQLFDHGVIVVATSNLPPSELYRDGLNRALFMPFIALLANHMDVIKLEARTDFRLEKLAGVQVWHSPADATAHTALESAWQKLTGGAAGTPQHLPLKGRSVHVPRAAMGAAWFGFDDLCVQPLGAIDFLKIAHEYHSVIVERIPVLSHENRNEAKRFILLIDTLYDNAVKLIASAQAEPGDLYLGSEGFEVGEFKRTVSRLIEMRSEVYLALPHGARAAPQAGGVGANLAGIVET